MSQQQSTELDLVARAASAQIVIGIVIAVGSAIALGIATAVIAMGGIIVGSLFVAGGIGVAVHGAVRRGRALRALKS